MTLKVLQVLRANVADEIDRLIAFLDMVDGYTMSELEQHARMKADNAMTKATSAIPVLVIRTVW